MADDTRVNKVTTTTGVTPGEPGAPAAPPSLGAAAARLEGGGSSLPTEATAPRERHAPAAPQHRPTSYRDMLAAFSPQALPIIPFELQEVLTDLSPASIEFAIDNLSDTVLSTPEPSHDSEDSEGVTRETDTKSKSQLQSLSDLASTRNITLSPAIQFKLDRALAGPPPEPESDDPSEPSRS